MEKAKENQKIERQRCKKCNSAFTYVRLKDMTRVCRNCGNAELIENKKEGEKKD